jgi:hypothetical protein
MTAAIHQPEAFPWLGFFDKWSRSEIFILLDHVPFEKNYFQNRNRIRTPGGRGWSWLTLPVRIKGRSGQPICEVEINPETDWRRKHLEALKTAYSRAPHFDDCWPFLRSHYEADWKYLADFNIALLRWMGERIGLHGNVLRSSAMGVGGAKSELLLGLCRAAGAGEYLSGISGRTYLDSGLFERGGVGVKYQAFRHPVYRQRHEPFVPALSGLDLLFNHGEEARAILSDASTPRLDAVYV